MERPLRTWCAQERLQQETHPDDAGGEASQNAVGGVEGKALEKIAVLLWRQMHSGKRSETSGRNHNSGVDYWLCLQKPPSPVPAGVFKKKTNQIAALEKDLVN